MAGGQWLQGTKPSAPRSGGSVQKEAALKHSHSPPDGPQTGGTLPPNSGRRKMASYTAGPEEEEYDVLIDGDLSDEEVDPCDKYTAAVLSAQQVGRFCFALFGVGLLANTLVLVILIKHKGLKQVENIYFLIVALSNLCFLLPLPFWALSAPQEGGLGRPVCGVLLTLHSFGLHGEALFYVLLTVSVSHVRWLSSALRTVTGGVITVGLAGLAAVLVSLPELVFYKSQSEDQNSKCSFSRPHFLPVEQPFWKQLLTVKMNVLVLVFPLSVLLCGCLRMRSRKEARERFKLVCAVVVVFLLMWAPYNIALFLSAFKESFSLHGCKSNSKLDAGIQVSKILATSHCWANLPLYAALDPAFRSHLCGWLPRCGPRLPQAGGGESAPGRHVDRQPGPVHSTPTRLHQRRDK